MERLPTTAARLQFMALILLATAILTVSSTFAWFTFSTNPQLTNVKATAAANGSLRIALMKDPEETSREVDERSRINGPGSTGGSTAGDYYTWGNLLDMTELMQDGTGEGLWPASFEEEGAVFRRPIYGPDGRVAETVELDDPTTAPYEDGREGFAVIGAGEKDYLLRLDFWLRTNLDGTISLSESRSRGGRGEPGQGSYIKCAALADFPPEAVGVVFRVTDAEGGGESWTLAEQQGGGDTFTLVADSLFEARANTSYRVQAYVYVNGLVVTNEHAAKAIEDLELNLQFSHSQIGEGGVEALPAT